MFCSEARIHIVFGIKYTYEAALNWNNIYPTAAIRYLIQNCNCINLQLAKNNIIQN